MPRKSPSHGKKPKSSFRQVPPLKTVIAVIVAVALTLGAVYGWNVWSAKRAEKTAEATAVRLDTVRRGDLAEVVQAPGEIQPRTKVSICARVSARILEIPNKEGTTVTAGNPKAVPPVPPSVLVRLDATDLAAALKSSEARAAAQQAQIRVQEAQIAAQKAQIAGTSVSLATARREFLREGQLLKTQFTSQSEFDESKRKLEEMESSLESMIHNLEADEAGLSAARHNREAAEADITKTRDNLSYATITSPIDGVVTRVNSKVGEIAVVGTMNNQGTVLLEVADLSTMLMVAKVSESDIAAVKPGQRARIHIQAYGDRVFEGRVDSVSLAPTIKDRDRDTEKNFTAEIVVDTRGGPILSGLTADVDVETSKHSGVLKVPSQAVLGRPADGLPADVRAKIAEPDRNKTVATVVCRMVNGKVQMVPVAVGPSDATHTIIRSGLDDGDRVITGPFKVLEKITHDMKVRDEAETTGTAKGKKSDVTTAPAK